MPVFYCIFFLFFNSVQVNVKIKAIAVQRHKVIKKRSGVIYCSVLVKKCPGAYSTQWRYIVHVINSNPVMLMLFIP